MAQHNLVDLIVHLLDFEMKNTGRKIIIIILRNILFDFALQAIF